MSFTGYRLDPSPGNLGLNLRPFFSNSCRAAEMYSRRCVPPKVIQYIPTLPGIASGLFKKASVDIKLGWGLAVTALTQHDEGDPVPLECGGAGERAHEEVDDQARDQVDVVPRLDPRHAQPTRQPVCHRSGGRHVLGAGSTAIGRPEGPPRPRRSLLHNLLILAAHGCHSNAVTPQPVCSTARNLLSTEQGRPQLGAAGGA